MEKRFPFVIGDLLATIFVTTAAVMLTTSWIGGALGMIPGMLIGMLLGMVIALVLSLVLLAPFLGAIEVLAPCMVSGMVGGMWGGMWPLAGGAILQWGAGTGVAAFVFVYGLNIVISGPQKIKG